VVDNDVRSAVVGEWKLGAGRGATDLLAVWIGTGIGGGLIINNALYKGNFNSAGEIGPHHLHPLMLRSAAARWSRSARAQPWWSGWPRCCGPTPSPV